MRKILLGASSLLLSTVALGEFYELPPSPKQLGKQNFSTLDHPNICNTLGPQRIAVILANYRGAPADSATPNAAYVKELFNGVDDQGNSLGFSVTDYYSTVSHKKTTLQPVTIAGPYQVPVPFSVDLSDPNNLYRGLDAWEANLLVLASHDVDLMNTDRVVFITPEAIDLTGAAIPMGGGLSAQGTCDLDYTGPEGHRTFAHSWVRASVQYKGIDITTLESSPGLLTPSQLQAAILQQNMLDMAPLIHELGHTFDLGHANQVKRPEVGLPPPVNDEVLPAQDQDLYEIEYGDPFSVMSANSVQWLSAAHLSFLNWFDPSEIQTVQAKGTFRIYPLETSGKLRALKVPCAIISLTDPSDPSLKNSEYLWIEFRQKLTPYDTDLTGLNHSLDGALVHYTNPEQPMPNNLYPNETILLNFVPSGPVSPFQSDFTLKTSWKDPHSMVTLQVVQVASQFIDIHVEFNQ